MFGKARGSLSAARTDVHRLQRLRVPRRQLPVQRFRLHVRRGLAAEVVVRVEVYEDAAGLGGNEAGESRAEDAVVVLVHLEDGGALAAAAGGAYGDRRGAGGGARAGGTSLGAATSGSWAAVGHPC